MTEAIGDLTVSVEESYDVDGEALFEALVDPAVASSATRADGPDVAVAPDDPPPRAGETYVGDVGVPFGAASPTFETYATVESAEYPRLVLEGGGDADAGSFDVRLVVAVADVPEGSVARADAKLDVAGDVARAGAETVRVAAARAMEAYLSDVECALASPRERL